MKSLFVPALAATLALAGCVAPTEPAPAPAPSPPPAPAPFPPVPAGPNPTVSGATMYANRTIAENAAAAPNLSTLVAAVRAADLTGTLSGPGPFTVFAPTNDAFNRLQPGMIDNLLRPENKASLTKVLTYHLLPGAISAAQIRQRIQAGGGTATLTTLAGQPLTARLDSGVVALTDTNGVVSYVETADVRQSNGVVHVINGVLAPRLP